MTLFPGHAQRRALSLRIRLRLARHLRRIVSCLVLACWFAVFAFAMPWAVEDFARDPASMGLLVLYALLAALALSWSEGD
jgi:hypothetical protein